MICHPLLRPAAVALMSLGLAHCAIDSGSQLPPEQVSVSTSDASQAAALISRYRVSRGLGPVTPDSSLSAAAAEQARAVAVRGQLTHGDFTTRMNTYGVRGAAAENLTAGSATVAAAIGRWQNSPRHNDNLLLPAASRIGLARATTGSGYGTYWALVLAQ